MKYSHAEYAFFTCTENVSTNTSSPVISCVKYCERCCSWLDVGTQLCSLPSRVNIIRSTSASFSNSMYNLFYKCCYILTSKQNPALISGGEFFSLKIADLLIVLSTYDLQFPIEISHRHVCCQCFRNKDQRTISKPLLSSNTWRPLWYGSPKLLLITFSHSSTECFSFYLTHH